ncbi:MAG: hypothetical protein A3E87_05175 [Gammaproteobacteria bacterium RIFCSPHIGHO2_12_FULL_35_23]|nr:MAG: hypothetical protein A3E87_05175 [Gammaproteobacteria bacterium RIFCSPHIGHO2_12_FULL_35_23]
MLKHNNSKAITPSRVVILGAKGFVGSATTTLLSKNNFNVLSLGQQEVDLSKNESVDKLTHILCPDDALIIVSAKAPCKNYTMLYENIAMMKNVCDALIKKPVKQVIYISSDAVYADSANKITESSLVASTSLHGIMHWAREQMLSSIIASQALLIMRPSLLYGKADPHNGYGPNSFYRLAAANKPIQLFGKGEELRDHVYINDVTEIIRLCLIHQSHGILNIATGNVISFYDIAQQIVKLFDHKADIICNPRNAPMPHNGYRAFDPSLSHRLFPAFQYTSFTEGILKTHFEYQAQFKEESYV